MDIGVFTFQLAEFMFLDMFYLMKVFSLMSRLMRNPHIGLAMETFRDSCQYNQSLDQKIQLSILYNKRNRYCLLQMFSYLNKNVRKLWFQQLRMVLHQVQFVLHLALNII